MESSSDTRAYTLKHHTKGKKPEAEEQILYDSIYMKYLEKANWQIYKERK